MQLFLLKGLKNSIRTDGKFNEHQSFLIEEIYSSQSSMLSQLRFPVPSKVSIRQSFANGDYYHIPSTAGLLIGRKGSDYRLGNESFTVIENLSLISKNRVESIQLPLLHKLGNPFLVFVENINKDVLNCISNDYSIQKTAYCQEKHLLELKEKAVEVKTEYKKGVHIRNFIRSKDEEAYIAFYNRILGFLGTLIDTSFMNNIMARPSFDPEGYFIAEENNKIVGLLSIEKEPWGESGSKFGYIYQIGVEKKWRGSGLAEVLFGKSIDFAVKHGINRIGVGVSNSNIPAIRFLKKQGFNLKYDTKGYLVSS